MMNTCKLLSLSSLAHQSRPRLVTESSYALDLTEAELPNAEHS